MAANLVQAWLTRQCELVCGVVRGVVVLATDDGPPSAHWPTEGGPSDELSSLANAARTQRDVIVRSRAPSELAPQAVCQVAVPFSTGSLVGVIAVELRDTKESELEPIVDLLRLGTHWLEVLQRSPDSGRYGAMSVEVAALALAQPSFQAATTTVTTELATRLGCERVSVGLTQRDAMRVHAVSHSARFDARANTILKVQAAMEEALDQDAAIAYPAVDGSVRITREHEQLAKEHAEGAAFTVPMASEERIIGALTFERIGTSFDPKTRERCEAAAALLGPILVLRRAAELGAFGRVRARLGTWLTELRGSEHPRTRIIAASILLLGLLLGFAQGEHRVTAEASIEGRVQRAIVAGIDGYIEATYARPGDVLKRGDPLGQLDDRDQLLERRKWTGRRDQLRKEYREALAGLDRAQVNIVSARIAQADAQLGLLEGDLMRTRLVAPFDGVVVRGDLSQSLGSPVAKGDVLFELAPLEGYRVILRVDERDIGWVESGRRGKLALAAMPGEPLPFTVDRVTPVASAEDGRNTFRVEARLDEPTAALRPGLEGVAKIEIARRRLIWIWTHETVDWLRLWAWSWSP